MPLHPQSKEFLQWMTREKVPQSSQLSPAEARTWETRISRLLNSREEKVARVENLEIAIDHQRKIPIRIYTPITQKKSSPIVYFHGGGWVVGDLDQEDLPCRLLANGTGHVVVSVEYRLAPEHKFPAAPEDCYVAARWVAENAERFGVDRKQIVVCGESAGGNLTAVVSAMAYDQCGPDITTQILIYPVTDLSCQYGNFPDELSPALTQKDIQWYINHYIGKPTDVHNQYASPLLRENLKGLPRTVMITAEYDILTQQCNEYANKLTKAGVQVHSECFRGMVHGFFMLPDLFDAAGDVIRIVSNTLH